MIMFWYFLVSTFECLVLKCTDFTDRLEIFIWKCFYVLWRILDDQQKTADAPVKTVLFIILLFLVSSEGKGIAQYLKNHSLIK